MSISKVTLSCVNDFSWRLDRDQFDIGKVKLTYVPTTKYLPHLRLCASKNSSKRTSENLYCCRFDSTYISLRRSLIEAFSDQGYQEISLKRVGCLLQVFFPGIQKELGSYQLLLHIPKPSSLPRKKEQI